MPRSMELVFQSWEDITITENHIRQLHRDLLVHSEKDERHRGSYKTGPNNVVAFDKNGKQIGIVFETATPFDTPRLMTELVTWFAESDEEKRLHPLLVIAIFTVVFLAIHPFQDGNGRLSRILTTLMLLRAGYAYVPYSSLESVIEQSKEGYYLALRQTQGHDPHRQPQLGAVAAVLPSRAAAAEGAAGKEDRARETRSLKPAGTFRADPRSCARTRPRQHRRDGQADRRQPQHAQGAFSATGREGLSRKAGWRTIDLVRAKVNRTRQRSD